MSPQPEIDASEGQYGPDAHGLAELRGTPQSVAPADECPTCGHARVGRSWACTALLGDHLCGCMNAWHNLEPSTEQPQAVSLDDVEVVRRRLTSEHPLGTGTLPALEALDRLTDRLQRAEQRIEKMTHGEQPTVHVPAEVFARLIEAETALQLAQGAVRQGRDLVNAMDEKMPEQAAEDEDGWIVNYRIPVGPWHRLLGWARGAGLLNALRRAEEERDAARADLSIFERLHNDDIDLNALSKDKIERVLEPRITDLETKLQAAEGALREIADKARPVKAMPRIAEANLDAAIDIARRYFESTEEGTE